jgi:hypothetical protein
MAGHAGMYVFKEFVHSCRQAFRVEQAGSDCPACLLCHP